MDFPRVFVEARELHWPTKKPISILLPQHVVTFFICLLDRERFRHGQPPFFAEGNSTMRYDVQKSMGHMLFCE